MKTTMTAARAIYLAEAMLAAIATDEVTPIITATNLSRVGSKLRAVATDRYRVHEVVLADAVTTGRKDESVNVPPSALTWLVRTLRIVAPRRKTYVTTVTIQTRKDADELVHIIVTIKNADSITTLDTLAIKGNYPPVSRLFDAAEQAERYDGPFSLNPTFLGKIEKLRDNRGGAVQFHPTASTTAGKPGPMLINVPIDGEEGTTARALVQPNLMLR